MFPNLRCLIQLAGLVLQRETLRKRTVPCSFREGIHAIVWDKTLAMCEMYCSIAGIFYRFDDLQISPDFRRQDMDMVELLVGYHPKKARKFSIVRKE